MGSNFEIEKRNMKLREGEKGELGSIEGTAHEMSVHVECRKVKGMTEEGTARYGNEEI